ncbi:hypothetical protein [Pararhizobium qamdonense]|uniref:hypothetical protein n=1 Tax=Pararhizobium qamdonense TaxID=3031126 RepID=UPI0023E2AB14|nr:hypothetical protein [Pararhizobium qamdonense]
MLIHQNGEILVEGTFTEEEVEAHIQRSGPASLEPKRIVMLAVLNQGHHSVAGWNIVLHRVYRNI